MKRKTGAREHTIIVGTMVASILVFVLGFFLGRAWVLMPQEKVVVKSQREAVPPGAPFKEKGTEEELTFYDQLEDTKFEKTQSIKRKEEEKRQTELARKRVEGKKRDIELLRQQEERKRRQTELARKRVEGKKRDIELLRQQEAKKRRQTELARKEAEERKKGVEKLKQEQEKEKREAELREAKLKRKAEEEKRKRDLTATPSKEQYTIQLESFQDKERVDEILQNLRFQGYSAFAAKADLKEKGTWYRIRLGSFSSRQEAEQVAAELKRKGTINKYWVTRG